jgi:hypothetical protein
MCMSHSQPYWFYKYKREVSQNLSTWDPVFKASRKKQSAIWTNSSQDMLLKNESLNKRGNWQPTLPWISLSSPLCFPLWQVAKSCHLLGIFWHQNTPCVARVEYCRMIRLKRIYNFWCSLLVYAPFALCVVTFRGVFMHFPELTY